MSSPVTSPITVRKVENQADFKAFFEFPWTLYKDDPNWVPPLLSMRHDQLDRKKNPSWEYMEGDHFTAWRGDKLVGTITAYINNRHNEFHKEHIGWFGTFEVYDDQEVATALLNCASEWVKAKGFDAIRGPQTFTTHEDVGLLVDGFIRPALLMPYNKPYMAKLIENAGFHKEMDHYSFYLDAEKVKAEGLFDRLERINNSIMKRNHITVRPVNAKNLKQDFVLFKELYNSAWDKNWGFVPMTPKELDALVAGLGQFFDARLAFYAYVENEPAGFILAIPDFNQVLEKVAARPGVPEPVSLLKAVWYWKIRPIMDWVRVPLMGVKEEYRKRGVDAVLYYHVLKAALDVGIKYSDSGWILEINEDMVKIAKSFGSEIYKTHRLYEKEL